MSEEKTIVRAPKFFGKDKWEEWADLFDNWMSAAWLDELMEARDNGGEIPRDEDGPFDEDSEEAILVKQNRKAFTTLVACFILPRGDPY